MSTQHQADQQLVEAFKALGLSEAGAAVAAQGRAGYQPATSRSASTAPAPEAITIQENTPHAVTLGASQRPAAARPLGPGPASSAELEAVFRTLGLSEAGARRAAEGRQ